MIAWRTPELPPGEPVCVQIWIPDGEEYRAILRGALILLFDPANFEQAGEQTPEDVASAFFLAGIDLEEDCP